MGERDRAYVLHGRVMEGILGNSERESFMIEEVKSPKESEGENVWLYVMVGIESGGRGPHRLFGV